MKNWFDTKKQNGVVDFQAYFANHPEEVPGAPPESGLSASTVRRWHCSALASFDEFIKGLSIVFPESYDAFGRRSSTTCRGAEGIRE